MQAQSKPTQQQLSAYLKQRRESEAPPPTQEEIRRQLGWNMRPGVPIERDRD